jgi:multisubunit Na+/H+ antiporter MnhB subunit
MMRSAQIVLLSAARFYTPLIALFAFSLLALYAPGAGVGFVAGLAFALTLTLHVIAFGAAAARAAAPPIVARLVLTLGLIASVAAAAAPGWAWSARAMEAGLFAAAVGAAALILAALTGRAPSLRDEDW